MTNVFWRSACASALAAGIVTAAGAVSAEAAPLAGMKASAHSQSQVIKVHRRSSRHSHHVDAPFTHVETGRRVIVDAPFTSVYVGRQGRYVRAPFVSLWIPR